MINLKETNVFLSIKKISINNSAILGKEKMEDHPLLLLRIDDRESDIFGVLRVNLLFGIKFKCLHILSCVLVFALQNSKPMLIGDFTVRAR